MQFLFPGALFGLFAISIPIIIHLFNFRRYKTVYFSNTKYLRNIKQETKSRSQLKHLLILLARILMITFLVLAFSKPFIIQEDTMSVAKDQAIGIYIDNSFSMEAESTYGKVFEVAKNRAFEILDSYDASTEFVYLTNDRKAKHNHFVNKEQLKEYISETEISPNFVPASEILNRFIELHSFHRAGKVQSKRLYLLSDMQKSTFDHTAFPMDSALQLTMVPLTTQITNNIYIDTIWFETPYRKYNADEKVHVRISNYSEESFRDIPISLFINDSARVYASVNLEPQSSETVILEYTNTTTGIMRGKVSLQDYPVVHDNDYYFSYQIADRIHLLELYEELPNQNLETLFSLDEYFLFDQASIQSADYSLLSKYNTIFLSELKSLSNAFINQLINYVEEGGRLVVIPSPDMQYDTYNLFFSAIDNNLVIGKDTSEIQMDQVNFLSDVYISSFSDVNDRYVLPKIKHSFLSSNYSNTRAIPLITAKNGDHLVNALRYKSGEIYTFYFPLSENRTSFCVHPLFVPTFYNIAMNSIHPQPISYIIGKDQVLELKLPGQVYDDVFVIQSNTGNYEFIPRVQQNSGRYRFFLYDQVFYAGNYNMKYKSETLTALAFNYDKSESILAFYSTKEIDKLIENAQFSMNIIENDASFQASLIQENQGIQLWYYFILLSILFIVLEILLIRFMK